MNICNFILKIKMYFFLTKFIFKFCSKKLVSAPFSRLQGRVAWPETHNFV